MTERPKTFVGKAGIVAFFFFGVEPDAPQRIGRMIGRDSEAIVRVDHFTIGASGTVGDPSAIAGEKDGLERSNKTAGGNDDADGFILVIQDVAYMALDSRRRRVACPATWCARWCGGAIPLPQWPGRR